MKIHSTPKSRFSIRFIKNAGIFSVVIMIAVSLMVSLKSPNGVSAQSIDGVVYSVFCTGHGDAPCWEQVINQPAQIDFRATWTDGVVNTYADFWTRTDEICPDGTSVQNDARVMNTLLTVTSDHWAYELRGFNLILDTDPIHPAFFWSNGNITPSQFIRHPEYCAIPPPLSVAGGCNGQPDFAHYPTGCATGFMLNGGICTRSLSFINHCNLFSSYDPIYCGCDGSCNPEGGGCSPIVVDTHGDGFSMTNGADGVPFDLQATGNPRLFSWTDAGSDDAWLALDRNGDGLISNGRELFGNVTSQPPPLDGEAMNGFLALAEFDTAGFGGNGDGKITNLDSIFSRLRLWKDVNHDGISNEEELYTLHELGLRKIDLDYRLSRRVDQFGNQFKYRAKIRDSQDAQLGRWAWDVFLLTP